MEKSFPNPDPFSSVSLLKVSVSPQSFYWSTDELTFKNTLTVLQKKLIKGSMHRQGIKEARVLGIMIHCVRGRVTNEKRNHITEPGELGIKSYPQSFGFNGKRQSCFITLIKCWSALMHYNWLNSTNSSQACRLDIGTYCYFSKLCIRVDHNTKISNICTCCIHCTRTPPAFWAFLIHSMYQHQNPHKP